MGGIMYLLSAIVLVVAMAISIWYIQQPRVGPLGESSGMPFEFILTMISTGCIAVFCFVLYWQHRRES